MPKLLLSVSDLRSLAGYAVRALCHPVATGQEAVTTVRTIAGGLVSQAARDVAPGAPPPTGPAPTGSAPSGPVAAEPMPEPTPAPTPEPTPDPEATAAAATAREAAPAPDDVAPRRTGPAPHLSRMPRDIERDVELELEDDEAAGSGGATFESTEPGREPEQPGEGELGDAGVAKSVRKERARGARASAAKKS